MNSPLNRQVGGTHYQTQGIQPIEFIERNGFPFSLGCAIKYVARWRLKGGVQDLEKAVHYLKFAGELLGGLLPGFNPTFERLGQYKAALFDPEPPRDAYRNRPIMPEDKWVDGSIPERMWGITKDVIAQAGFPVNVSNYRNENLPAGLAGALSLPVLRTVVASDNYYGVLDEQRRRYDEKLASAAARNMRGEVTRDMVRRYESLKSKGEDNRTDIEAAEYDALRQWHNRDYEGSERRPGLMQDLREAAKAKQTDDDLTKAVLMGQAKDSAAALEASAQDLRELLRELRRESQ